MRGSARRLRPARSGSPRPQRDSGYAGSTRPRFLPPDREQLGRGCLPAPDAGAEQPLALLVSRSKVEGQSPYWLQKSPYTYSPQLFLSLRFLAMVVQGLVAVRRCHCARSSSGPRLQAAGGSVPAWAPFAQTPKMLLWRWWEGVGRRREEKTVDQAQHHKPKSTQTPASHPPCLGPPLEREDSD